MTLEYILKWIDNLITSRQMSILDDIDACKNEYLIKVLWDEYKESIEVESYFNGLSAEILRKSEGKSWEDIVSQYPDPKSIVINNTPKIVTKTEMFRKLINDFDQSQYIIGNRKQVDISDRMLFTESETKKLLASIRKLKSKSWNENTMNFSLISKLFNKACGQSKKFCEKLGIDPYGNKINEVRCEDE